MKVALLALSAALALSGCGPVVNRLDALNGNDQSTVADDE